MRPYSHYLNDFLGENPTVKYNISGSTPPLTDWLKKQIVQVELNPENHRIELVQIKNLLAEKFLCKPDNVQIVPGSTQAYFQTLAAISSPGDTILIEYPCYDPYLATARFLGLEVLRFNRSNNFENDLADLKSKAKRAKFLLISNPHCPAGWTYSSENIKALGQLGPKVIVDEVFLPLFSNGLITNHRNLKNLENFIFISSLSKSTGLGSYRMGWTISDTDTAKKISQIGLHLHIEVPIPIVPILKFTLANFEKITGDLIKNANENRAALQSFAKEYHCALSHSFDTGFYVMLKAPAAFPTGDLFVQELLNKGLFLRDGGYFEMPEWVRLHNLFSPADFTNILAILKQYY